MKVLLPVRPNGTEGWIRESDVMLSKHAFRIRVELAAHRITVLNRDQVILQEPIGVGTAAHPTPGGEYYTTDLLKQPDPRGPYGPYAYGLSGYSPVLTEFGGGDGQLGIHGTNDPASLGTDVSHGCIRISNAGITRLAGVLPLGVPVEVDP
jgi:lipoprotein-anchoring transpeptidase ErfK/SrfK